MEKLIKYINAMPVIEREAFAFKCGTTVGYLRKACSVRQALGPVICLAIERTTNGAVTRRDLRPDDCASIWPDLAETVAA
jgi:DNA-binding transcriptional regulator YdaS (Cro superfamily)